MLYFIFKGQIINAETYKKELVGSISKCRYISFIGKPLRAIETPKGTHVNAFLVLNIYIININHWESLENTDIT